MEKDGAAALEKESEGGNKKCRKRKKEESPELESLIKETQRQISRSNQILENHLTSQSQTLKSSWITWVQGTLASLPDKHFYEAKDVINPLLQGIVNNIEREERKNLAEPEKEDLPPP